jgi:hypothetical protein
VRLRGRWARNAQKLGSPFCFKDKLRARWKVEVDARLQLKGLSIVIRRVKFSTPSKNADDVTNVRSRYKTPDLEEPNPIDVQPLGMDLVP